jgi:transcriptional regulator with XRE-family HTH domain
MNLQIGRKIASKRIEKGYTQETFAAMLAISQSDISKIENGTKELNDNLRENIAKELEIDIHELVPNGEIVLMHNTFNHSSPNIASAINIKININFNLNIDEMEKFKSSYPSFIEEIIKQHEK